MSSALTMLKRQDSRRAIVVMTDGRDENNAGTAPGSRQTLGDVLNLSKNVDAAIFPIGLGSNVDRGGLEQVAAISGGRASFPSDATLLKDEFHETIENLRRRYVIGYTSTHVAPRRLLARCHHPVARRQPHRSQSQRVLRP